MITIKKSPAADSRTAQGPVSRMELIQSSKLHIKDVGKAMMFFQEMLQIIGIKHDYTKLSEHEMFYKDFRMWQKEGFDKKSEWYDMHIKNERHHLTEHCPDDVNLIDVLEMIADGVMAGMGRSGSVYIQDLDPEILQKAYRNTFELLQKQVVVEAE